MLKDNLQNLRSLTAESCKKSARNPSEITLLAVTKVADESQIKEVAALGLSDFGENRVQDALKRSALYGSLGDIKVHFIGHLQRNKAKDAVKLFSLIHSIDSGSILNEVNKEAEKAGKIQDVLVEVNTSAERSKLGLNPDELENFLKSVSYLKFISIKGLMTVAPLVLDKEKTRPYFRKLKDLFEKIKVLDLKNMDFKYLSMGMSQDFEVAIEEGANIIRIGTALFKD